MFCKKCGSKLVNGFCLVCGTRQEADDMKDSIYVTWKIALIHDDDGYSCFDAAFSLETEKYPTRYKAMEEITSRIENELKEEKFDKSMLPSEEKITSNSYIRKLSGRPDLYHISIEEIQVDSWLYDDHSDEEIDEALEYQGNYPVCLIKTEDGYFCYDIRFGIDTNIQPTPISAMEEIRLALNDELLEEDVDVPDEEEVLNDKYIRKLTKKRDDLKVSVVKVKVEL